MGGKKGNKSKKSKTKLTGKQKLQALGRAPKDIGKKTKTISIAPGTTGIGPVASGSAYGKALQKRAKNQKKTLASQGTVGIGPFADGQKYADALKKSPPRFSGGTMEQQKAALREGTDGKLLATNYNDLGSGLQNILQNQYKAFEKQGLGDKELKRLKDMYPGFTPRAGITDETQTAQSSLGISNALASAGDLTGLGIGSTPSYFSIKSPESFGAPSQEAVDKAAGITAGGLNIGGSGFTPDNPSGARSRVIGLTSEQLADRYKTTLKPHSFKGLSDGETFGSGPVASGEDYARG